MSFLVHHHHFNLLSQKYFKHFNIVNLHSYFHKSYILYYFAHFNNIDCNQNAFNFFHLNKTKIDLCILKIDCDIDFQNCSYIKIFIEN